MRPVRLILRLPSWVGDIVQCEPIVRAIHDRLGGPAESGRGDAMLSLVASLTLVAPKRLLELFEGRFPRAQRIAIDADAPESPQVYRDHDAALLLNGSWRSAWCAFAAGVPDRVGSARGGRGPLLTRAISPAREAGATAIGVGRTGRAPRYLPRPFGATSAELAGAVGVAVADARPRLEATPRSRAAVAERLAHSGVDGAEPFVLVNAGARPHSAKGYPADGWRGVLESLAERGLPRAVVIAAPGEEGPAREAVAGARRSGAKLDLPPVLLDDPAPGLAELVALCERASLLATADSGPRHVAVATGCPVVAICGPTDPRHTADHLGETRVLRVEVPCGPCHEERCPLPGRAAQAESSPDRAGQQAARAGIGDPEHLACMRRIEPQEIAAAAADLLQPEIAAPAADLLRPGIAAPAAADRGCSRGSPRLR